MNHFELQPELGKRIVIWRKLKGVSRRQLAKSIGIAHQSLQQIENGSTTSPRILSLIRIASFFEKSLEELLGEPLADDVFLVKIPPAVHLTEGDKSRLKMRIDFELSILDKNAAN